MKLLTIQKSGSSVVYEDSIFFDKTSIDNIYINMPNGVLQSSNNTSSIVLPQSSGSIFMYAMSNSLTQSEEYNILGGDLSGSIQIQQFVKSVKNVKSGILSFANGGIGKNNAFGIILSGGSNLSDKQSYYNNLASSNVSLTPCVENGKWVFKDLNKIIKKGYLFTGLGIRLTESITSTRNYFTVNKTTGLLPGDKIYISRVTNYISNGYTAYDSWIVSSLTSNRIYVTSQIGSSGNANDGYMEGFSITKDWTWYRKDNSSVADLIIVGGGAGGAASSFSYPSTTNTLCGGSAGGISGNALFINIPNPLLKSASIVIGMGGAGGFVSGNSITIEGRNGTDTSFITQYETLKAGGGLGGRTGNSSNSIFGNGGQTLVVGAGAFRVYEGQVEAAASMVGTPTTGTDAAQIYCNDGLPGGGGGGGYCTINSFSQGTKGIGVIINGQNYGGDSSSKDSTLYDITHITQLEGAYIYGEVDGVYYSGTYVSPLPKILATGGAGSAGSYTTTGNKAGNGYYGAGGGGAGAINNNASYPLKMLGGWGGDGYVLITTY